MVDDKVELWPVSGCFPHISYIGMRQQVREFFSDRGREQSLVHADIDQPGLEASLVERVDYLLVIHAPGILTQLLMRIVADGVALTRVSLKLGNGTVDLLQPARLPWSEDGVGEHTARAGFLVHLGACLYLHLVGEEPVLRHVRGRPTDTGDLGIAVEEDL